MEEEGRSIYVDVKEKELAFTEKDEIEQMTTGSQPLLTKE